MYLVKWRESLDTSSEISCCQQQVYAFSQLYILLLVFTYINLCVCSVCVCVVCVCVCVRACAYVWNHAHKPPLHTVATPTSCTLPTHLSFLPFSVYRTLLESGYRRSLGRFGKHSRKFRHNCTYCVRWS